MRNTEIAAYANVQTKTRTNGSRYSGFVRTVEKFSKPTCVRQPGSSASPDGGHVRALAVVREHRAGLDVRERVGFGVVDERRLQLDRDAQALGADEAVSRRRDDERGELRVDAGELARPAATS